MEPVKLETLVTYPAAWEESAVQKMQPEKSVGPLKSVNQ